MYCKKCGTILDKNAKFCRKCGAPIKDEASHKFCKNCGIQLSKEQIFCTNCGLRMDEGTTVTSKANVPQEENPVKTFEYITYASGEVTEPSMKMKRGSSIFQKDKIELYMDNDSGQAVGRMLGGALGGAIIGIIEASKNASNGVKPTVVIPYMSIVKYVSSSILLNKSIIIYLNDGTIYTLVLGTESNQQDALSILKKYCR